MRNTTNTTMTQSSSTSTTHQHHHPHPLLTHTTTTIVDGYSNYDGYDFNRARSTESTENTLPNNGKGINNNISSNSNSDARRIAVVASAAAAPEESSPASCSFSSSAEDRGVPISPKKLPQTPPRDHGSPYRPNGSASTSSVGFGMGWMLSPSTVRPFPSGCDGYSCGSDSGSTADDGAAAISQPFLRPSSWNRKEDDHAASSVFRKSPLRSSSIFLSRESDSDYTIQQSFAFDDDDDDHDVRSDWER